MGPNHFNNHYVPLYRAPFGLTICVCDGIFSTRVHYNVVTIPLLSAGRARQLRGAF